MQDFSRFQNFRVTKTSIQVLGVFKILAFQNPEFRILADFNILAFQNPQFKILANLKI